MGSEEVPDEDPVAAIYHRALPHVYGYLLSRCGDVEPRRGPGRGDVHGRGRGSTASPGAPEARPSPPAGSSAWPGTSWPTTGGAASGKSAATPRPGRGRGWAGDALDDPWDEWLDAEAAYAALRCLPAPQRAALTLRYLDGLPVAEVAAHLGRSVHATETLLARSRAALRAVYQGVRQEGRHGR